MADDAIADEDALADLPTEGWASPEPLTCTSCGRPLGDSGDDQPDWPAGPLCADCYQAQQMDDEIWWSEMDGGT